MKSSTAAVLNITADSDELIGLKQHVLTHFREKVKLPGFREGKAPLELIEKHLNPAELQSEFLEEALERFYIAAMQQENLRPVQTPDIELKKFVPFTALEFEARVSVLGEINLPDYMKIRLARKAVKVTEQDVADVLDSLATRMSQKKEVRRAARKGDEAWIDFKGVDSKGEAVKGADGKDYPLLLGSDTFIPGFEANIIGMKAGEEKTFTLTFPKNYGVGALQGRKVTFTVTLKKLEEILKPKLDDAFAAQAGPFESLRELKDDIRRQISTDRARQAQAEYEAELIKQITAKSKVELPEQLIDEQTEALLRDFKQNLSYRGLTWQEYLDREATTEDDYIKKEVRPQAAERLKASLVLSEISERENIQITNHELDERMQALKAQYQDPAMQTELDKPETRRDIASRMLTEKTIALLAASASR